MRINNLIQRQINKKQNEIKSQKGISFAALQALYRDLKNQDISPRERHHILRDLIQKAAQLRVTRQNRSFVAEINTNLTLPTDHLVKTRQIYLSNRLLLQSNRIPLYNHLVLDSLTPHFKRHIDDNGIPREMSLAFLETQLAAFASKCDLKMKEQVLNLQKSLNFSLKIETICIDFQQENKALFDHEDQISTLLSNALEGLKADPQHTPIALCAGTTHHGVVLMISYSEASKYLFTVLNTGEGVIQDQENGFISDLHFSQLSQEDFKTLPKQLLNTFSNYNLFIHNLTKDFNRTKSESIYLHKPQKGNSCASKSLTLFLKLSMDTCLNKHFKVFLTKTFLRSEQSEVKTLLGRRILEKRVLKYHWHLLEDLTTKEMPEHERAIAVKNIMNKHAYHYHPDLSSIDNAELAMRRLHEAWEHVSDPEEISKLLQHV